MIASGLRIKALGRLTAALRGSRDATLDRNPLRSFFRPNYPGSMKTKKQHQEPSRKTLVRVNCVLDILDEHHGDANLALAAIRTAATLRAQERERLAREATILAPWIDSPRRAVKTEPKEMTE